MVISWGLDSMTSSQVGKPPLLVSRASTFSPQLVHVAHSPSLSQLCLRPLSLGMFWSHPPLARAPWNPGSQKTLVKGVPALTNMSTCMCTWTGFITIINSGARAHDHRFLFRHVLHLKINPSTKLK